MERLPGYDNWKLDNDEEEQPEVVPFYEHEDFDPDTYNDLMEDR